MLTLQRYKNYLTSLTKNLKREKGQTMVEYVMLIVLVALAVFLASPSITSAIMSVFTKTSSVLGK